VTGQIVVETEIVSTISAPVEHEVTVGGQEITVFVRVL